MTLTGLFSTPAGGISVCFKAVTRLLLVIALSALASGCIDHPQLGTPSLAFARVAEKFKAKAGHDRFSEGRKIQSLLPKCRATWQKDIGTGTLTSYDYDHPSYKLSKQDLFQTLGPPNRFYDDAVSYDLVQYSNGMVWKLLVDLRNDYVVGSTISGGLKSDK